MDDVMQNGGNEKLGAGSVVAVYLGVPLDQPFDYITPIAVEIGAVVEVPFGARQMLGVVWGRGKSDANSKLKTISRITEYPRIEDNLRKFIAHMSEYTLAPIGLILKMILRAGETPPKRPRELQAVKDIDPKQLTQKRRALYIALEKGTKNPSDLNFSSSVIKGLIEDGGARWVETPKHDLPKILPNADRLSEAQKAALLDCVNTDRPVLLKGVTGSGKTEIYLEWAAEEMAAGKQVLILLPEIALTSAFIERCKARFGFSPGHWHSDMKPAERREVWHKVASGELPIVVGARSALFLPFCNLGLIVVDEEHDRGYKQEEGVIYNGRDMAVLRASYEGAHLLLASATPSIESMVNAKSGKYKEVTLAERYGVAVLPSVRRLDMREAGLDARHFIAPELTRQIQNRMALGEQSLLFLNRRGYAPLTLCRACGHQIECPQCDARLVEHRARPRLICHQCGFETPKPRACPNCGVEDKLAPIGPGVERLAEEVLELIPEARTTVLSSDMQGGEAAIQREIAAIANGEYDVIIGTQMVAKGHNFPALTLIGIIDADIGLEGGDLRAAENSFQLLRQVTGRAGRADKAGVALVQSYQPDHPILGAILASDDTRFYEEEIARRQAANAPPYSRYVGVIISAPKLEDAIGFARKMALESQRLREAQIEILGPAIAPIAQIRGRARVRLLLKLPKNARLLPIVRQWFFSLRPPTNIRAAIDVDPVSFY